ncbi:MAG: hypothetical protein ABIT01_19355 [Thermoanaerobaculia bacterium]
MPTSEVSTGFTVELRPGNVPGTTRVLFSWGSTWIATFHTCGETIGAPALRRGHDTAASVLTPRVVPILRTAMTFARHLNNLANTDP